MCVGGGVVVVGILPDQFPCKSVFIRVSKKFSTIRDWRDSDKIPIEIHVLVLFRKKNYLET
jgi:hypothetical protein